MPSALLPGYCSVLNISPLLMIRLIESAEEIKGFNLDLTLVLKHDSLSRFARSISDAESQIKPTFLLW